ncbi:HYC_CC_PP family protein [Mucilaginibacter gotjawali]|uniref:Uncharacterized protein n=1 Tax=Mucilaginibacter gotjawali TaxID=1550579 RepID=A0A839SML9_9SPHI|nr:hypothetical protein [Mucilaginibacter gotjawali]MBB3058090.1 hypothetical protein [Mucilaginibacter gotjawali]
MKRTALILLSAIYLLSCTGISANSQYCCGVLQSTTLSESPKAACKMNIPMKSCCKSKKQYFKVKDQHVSPSAFGFYTKLAPAMAVLYLPFISNLNIPVREIVYFNNHAPPDRRHATPSYILNCTYRI